MPTPSQTWTLETAAAVRDALYARRRRLAVLLTGPKPSSDETADRWLIQLRWGAIAGMIATTAAGKALVPGLELAPLAAGLAGIAAINLGWAWLVRGAAARAREAAALVAAAAAAAPVATAAPPDAPAPEAEKLTRAQIIGDVVAVTWMLWFSGGLQSPFAAFLTFQIALSGLLCSRRTTVWVGLLTLLAIAALIPAPSLPLASAPLGAERIRQLGLVASLAALSLFLGFFVVVYGHRLEELREQSVRNERMAMVGRMVGGISHELSTPLATILLASRDLVDVARETGSEEATRLAETVAGEAQRASEIISLVRGQIRPDQRLEAVELAGFVEQVTRAELKRLGYQGEVVFDAPRPVRARVLRSALRQVLVNVVTNAVEAMAATPARRIEVQVEERGDLVEIAVSDSGPGFSAAMEGRLGEPFQTTKEPQGGMGLGLYISSVMAARMNAVLRVESAVARGATVTLCLHRGAADEGEG